MSGFFGSTSNTGNALNSSNNISNPSGNPSPSNLASSPFSFGNHGSNASFFSSSAAISPPQQQQQQQQQMQPSTHFNITNSFTGSGIAPIFPNPTSTSVTFPSANFSSPTIFPGVSSTLGTSTGSLPTSSGFKNSSMQNNPLLSTSFPVSSVFQKSSFGQISPTTNNSSAEMTKNSTSSFTFGTSSNLMQPSHRTDTTNASNSSHVFGSSMNVNRINSSGGGSATNTSIFGMPSTMNTTTVPLDTSTTHSESHKTHAFGTSSILGSPHPFRVMNQTNVATDAATSHTTPATSTNVRSPFSNPFVSTHPFTTTNTSTNTNIGTNQVPSQPFSFGKSPFGGGGGSSSSNNTMTTTTSSSTNPFQPNGPFPSSSPFQTSGPSTFSGLSNAMAPFPSTSFPTAKNNETMLMASTSINQDRDDFDDGQDEEEMMNDDTKGAFITGHNNAPSQAGTQQEQKEEQLAKLKAKIEEKRRLLMEKRQRPKVTDTSSTSSSITNITSARMENSNSGIFDTALVGDDNSKAMVESKLLMASDPTKISYSSSTSDSVSLTKMNPSALPFAPSTAIEQANMVIQARNSKPQLQDSEIDEVDPAVMMNTSLVGSCLTMCPEEELLRRENENDIQILETPHPSIYPNGWTIRETAVKRFRRSAADYKLDIPSLVRPPHILEKTCAYLEEWVMERDRQGIDQRYALSGKSGVPPPLDVYLFIWDRTRMIRKDFILQNFIGTGGKCSATAVRVHERIARWHAMCEHQLSHLPDFTTQSQQNIQELGQTMKTLNLYYDDSQGRSVKEENDQVIMPVGSNIHGCISHVVMGPSPIDYDGRSLNNVAPSSSKRIVGIRGNHDSVGTAEPEMRALYILLTANNDGGMEVIKYAGRLSVLKPEIFKSNLVQLALQIFKAKKEYNYARFFSILRDPSTPYLFACIMYKYVEQMREAAFRIMSKTYGARKKDSEEGASDMYPLAELVHLLCFEDLNEARAACVHYNITVETMIGNGDGIDIIAWKKSEFCKPRDPVKGTTFHLKPWKMVRTIETKLRGATRLAVCRGDVSCNQITGTQQSSLSENLPLDSKVADSVTPTDLSQNETEKLRFAAETLRFEEEAKRIEVEDKLRLEVIARQDEEAKIKERRRLDEIIRVESARKEEVARKREEAQRLEHIRELEESRRVAAEKDAQLLKQQEERRRRQDIERQQQDEARRILEMRQREEQYRLEEEKRRLLEEEERRNQLIRKLEREREEDRIRRQHEQAEKDKIREKNWMKKLEIAKKIYCLKKWKKCMEFRNYKSASIRKSLDFLSPTCSRLSVSPKLRSTDGRDLSMYRESFDSLETWLYCLGTDVSVTIDLKKAFETARNRQKSPSTNRVCSVLLLKIVLVVVDCDHQPNTLSRLIRTWVNSRVEFGSVYDPDGCIRSVVVDGTDSPNELENCDAALIIIPPITNGSNLSRHTSHFNEIAMHVVPRIVLNLDLHENPTYTQEIQAVVNILSANRSSFAELKVGGTLFEHGKLDDDLFLCFEAIVEEIIRRSAEEGFRKGIEKISLASLVCVLLRTILWGCPIRSDIIDTLQPHQKRLSSNYLQENYMLCIRKAVYFFLEEISQIRINLDSRHILHSWPADEFVDAESTVKIYFTDEDDLPKNWIDSIDSRQLEAQMRDVLPSLFDAQTSALSFLEDTLAHAPLVVREHCVALLEGNQAQAALDQSISWMERDWRISTIIYLPCGEITALTNRVISRVLPTITVDFFSNKADFPPHEQELGQVCPSKDVIIHEPIPLKDVERQTKRAYSKDSCTMIDKGLVTQEAKRRRPLNKNHMSNVVADSKKFTAQLLSLMDQKMTIDMTIGDTSLSHILMNAPKKHLDSRSS